MLNSNERRLKEISNVTTFLKNECKDMEDAYLKEKQLQKKSGYTFISIPQKTKLMDLPLMMEWKSKRKPKMKLNIGAYRKAYLLMNYPIADWMFKGRNIQLSSLNTFKIACKRILKDETNKKLPYYLRYQKKILDYLKNVENLKPFPVIDSDGKPLQNVIELIGSGCLTEDEINFINSPVAPLEEEITEQKEEVMQQEDTLSEISTKYKSGRNKILTDNQLKFMFENSDKSLETIYKELNTTASKKTISNYLCFIRALRSGREIQMKYEHLRRYYEKLQATRSSKEKMLDKIYSTILNNLDCTPQQIVGKLNNPNIKVSTVKSYMDYFRSLANGKKINYRPTLNKFYELYMGKSLRKCTSVAPIEKTSISIQSDDSYALLINNEIKFVGQSKEFISGAMAMAELSNTECKMVKLQVISQ